jgi:hypothetical protein
VVELCHAILAADVRCGAARIVEFLALSPSTPALAFDWVPWIVALCVLSVVVLILIVVAPWKRVRSETGIDDEAETRLLLGDDPEEIDRDLAAREAERRAHVADFRPRDDS